MTIPRSKPPEKQSMTGNSSRRAGSGRTHPGAVRSRSLYLLVCTASACVLGACGGGGDGPSQPIVPVPLPLAPGTYEATVTGDRSFSRSGTAYMFPLAGRLVILMGTNPRAAGADTMITLALNGTSPPEIGTRSVTTYFPSGETISSLAFKDANTNITDIFKSTASSGTLTVTQSSSGSVSGEFAVDLDGGRFPADPATAPQHVHVTGRFYALP
jgi:hypothetical protein